LHKHNGVERHNPYNLVTGPLINEQTVSGMSNFAIISSTGVTYYTDGSAEYNTLSEWSSHTRVFNILLSKKIFACFPLISSFFALKHYVKNTRLEKTRSKLSKRLLHTDKLFGKALREVRRADI
jgi:hypothetical protein